MGPCVACFSINYGEDVVIDFKCKSVNISYYHVKFLGELGMVEYFLPLGILGIVVKSPKSTTQKVINLSLSGYFESDLASGFVA